MARETLSYRLAQLQISNGWRRAEFTSAEIKRAPRRTLGTLLSAENFIGDNIT
jgi:hypothetical protein